MHTHLSPCAVSLLKRSYRINHDFHIYFSYFIGLDAFMIIENILERKLNKKVY